MAKTEVFVESGIKDSPLAIGVRLNLPLTPGPFQSVTAPGSRSESRR